MAFWRKALGGANGIRLAAVDDPDDPPQQQIAKVLLPPPGDAAAIRKMAPFSRRPGYSSSVCSDSDESMTCVAPFRSGPLDAASHAAQQQQEDQCRSMSLSTSEASSARSSLDSETRSACEAAASQCSSSLGGCGPRSSSECSMSSTSDACVLAMYPSAHHHYHPHAPPLLRLPCISATHADGTPLSCSPPATHRGLPSPRPAAAAIDAAWQSSSWFSSSLLAVPAAATYSGYGGGVPQAGGSGRTLLADLPEGVPVSPHASACTALSCPARQFELPSPSASGRSSDVSSTSLPSSSALPSFLTSAVEAEPSAGSESSSSNDEDGCSKATRGEISAALGFAVGATQLRHGSSRPPPSRTVSGPLGADIMFLPEGQGAIASADSGCLPSPTLQRQRSSYLTNGHAAAELFLRLNHARQTLDFVKRQAASFAALDRADLDIWEALGLLSELHEHEPALQGDDESADMGLVEHAFQTAELCRLAHPHDDWLHLVGLLHGLGKLLGHKMWGSQPPWAVCGETYPVGCRFSPLIAGSEFFIASPDRRRRQLNTPCGMYSEHCGLTNVYKSWGSAEYLYLVLALNDTTLPAEALFLIRHQKFRTVLPAADGARRSRAGGGAAAAAEGAYGHLLSAADRRMLPLLAEFQELAAYRDVGPLPQGALHGAERRAYYDGLINKYIGPGKLQW